MARLQPEFNTRARESVHHLNILASPVGEPAPGPIPSSSCQGSSRQSLCSYHDTCDANLRRDTGNQLEGLLAPGAHFLRRSIQVQVPSSSRHARSLRVRTVALLVNLKATDTRIATLCDDQYTATLDTLSQTDNETFSGDLIRKTQAWFRPGAGQVERRETPHTSSYAPATPATVTPATGGGGGFVGGTAAAVQL
jgi:hypothetical protein